MFDFTNDERKSLLFLAAIVFIGLAISAVSKKFPQINKVVSLSREVFQLDLNHVNKQALLDIPGLGEKTAERILNYRQENGLFHDKEELRKIKGINSYRYEKIKSYFR